MKTLEKLWNVAYGRINPPPPPPIKMRTYNQFIKFFSKLESDPKAVEKLTKAYEAYNSALIKANKDLNIAIDEIKKGHLKISSSNMKKPTLKSKPR